MNPKISNISEERDVYQFTLSDINVSLANALRRTILSDIPTYSFYTESYNDSQCVIHVNTTRLHNEIIKQRLSCVPIHETDLTLLVGKYQLDLDMQNDTEDMIIITTEHFRIRNKETGNYLTKDETRRIFPPNSKTNCFIEFARIRPRIGDSIPGEQLKLVADFSVRTAFENSTFNVVSKCSYGNTIDVAEVAKIWEEQEAKLRSEELPGDEIAFQKKNFYLLDAQRHFVENSFDFVIQTIGVFENRELLKMGCTSIIKKLTLLVDSIDSEIVPILNGETTMDNCFDIILEHEDYTIGKVLEYILYETYYVRDKIFTYCGFKKFHPHNADSTIRIAYLEPADRRMVGQHLRIACTEAADVFYKLKAMF